MVYNINYSDNVTIKCYYFRYAVDDFEKSMTDMYQEVEPLYIQLHAYVRRKLFMKYGKVSLKFINHTNKVGYIYII